MSFAQHSDLSITPRNVLVQRRTTGSLLSFHGITGAVSQLPTGHLEEDGREHGDAEDQTGRHDGGFGDADVREHGWEPVGG